MFVTTDLMTELQRRDTEILRLKSILALLTPEEILMHQARTCYDNVVSTLPYNGSFNIGTWRHFK